MKKIFLFICLSFCGYGAFANKIDDLKNNYAVFKFLSPLVAKLYYADVDRNWQVKSWQKLDVNNDGRTDLLAHEYEGTENHDLVAIDQGNDTYQIIQLNLNDRGDDELVEAINYKNQQMLVFHGFRLITTTGVKQKKVARTDTLIYKFKNFVEYREKVADQKIDTITYSSIWGWYSKTNSPAESKLPDLQIRIAPTGKASFVNNRRSVAYVMNKKGEKVRVDPKTTKGRYNSTVKKADLDDITGLINYINVKKLKNIYKADDTDETNNCYLRVKFGDGSVKDIIDHGGQGTWGLKAVFAMIVALGDSQDWK